MRRIWLIRTFEVLPIDEKTPRLHRMGLIAEICAQNPENDVTWWCADLNQFKKYSRFGQDKTIRLSSNYQLKIVHAPGYTKNMSMRRLWHQFYEARHWYELAHKEEKPDVILCAMPTNEYAYYATKYANKFNIPIFIDIRDTFPDMYVEFCDKKIKPFVKLGIIPYKWMLANALKHASGLIASSDNYMDWALKYAKRERGENDKVYYISYPDNTAIHITEESMSFWYKQGLKKEDFICCFFGQFGFTVDLETVMKAAVLIANKNSNVKFVICGVGERISSYKKIHQFTTF